MAFESHILTAYPLDRVRASTEMCLAVTKAVTAEYGVVSPLQLPHVPVTCACWCLQTFQDSIGGCPSM